MLSLARNNLLDYNVVVSRIHYRKGTDLPWRRAKKNKGFVFINEKGKRISKRAKARVLGLAIPPAWHDVVISSDPWDYVQAIGVDARGRKQYIYHPEWLKHNQEHKFDQMIMFGEKLPTLRRAVKAHMDERKLTKDRVVATVVWLLDHTFIRVGNEKYAEENQSYGLTTMRQKHIEVRANTLTFSFEGKSGVFHELDVTNPKVAKTVKACFDIPGYELFHYLDETGNKRVVDSRDVNDYLQTHAGADFSAKEFRTWGGSVMAGDSLYKKGNANDENDFKRNLSEVIEVVSTHLGNTKSVSRKYYVHPIIISSYEKKVLVPHFAHSYGRSSAKKFSLSKEEYATWSLIKDS